MAVDLKRIDEEGRAIPAEQFVQIEHHAGCGQAIVGSAAPQSARQIAPHFALLLQSERDAGVHKLRAQAIPIPGQRILLPKAGGCFGWLRLGLRGRRQREG